MPGVTVNFTQPMAMRLDEVVSGVKADVAVKIFGEDSADARAARPARSRRVLASVRGVGRPAGGGLLGRRRSCRSTIDRQAIARYGLDVADVQRVVEAAVGGTDATDVLDGPRRIPRGREVARGACAPTRRRSAACC